MYKNLFIRFQYILGIQNSIVLLSSFSVKGFVIENMLTFNFTEFRKKNIEKLLIKYFFGNLEVFFISIWRNFRECM